MVVLIDLAETTIISVIVVFAYAYLFLLPRTAFVLTRRGPRTECKRCGGLGYLRLEYPGRRVKIPPEEWARGGSRRLLYTQHNLMSCHVCQELGTVPLTRPATVLGWTLGSTSSSPPSPPEDNEEE
jgi:hypothetical protein